MFPIALTGWAKARLLPDPEIDLLLGAALCEGQAAGEAWERWRASTSPRVAGREAQSLFPQVSSNLRLHGVRCRDDDYLEELRREAWVQNQVRMRELEGVLDMLSIVGVVPIVLKGCALAPAVYPGLGCRPMQDIDLLVPDAQVAAAREALEGGGYRCDAAMAKWYRELQHALTFGAPGRSSVDLHWNILKYSLAPDLPLALWRRKAELAWNGRSFFVLSPADQVLHSLLHGLERRGAPSNKWVLDVALTLRRQGEGFDWDSLVEAAAEARVSWLVRLGLEYVSSWSFAEVPEAVLERLVGEPVSWPEGLEVLIKANPFALRFAGFPAPLVRYLRRCQARGRRPGPLGFARYLSRWLDAGSVWGLPLEMLRRVARRSWSGLGGDR